MRKLNSLFLVLAITGLPASAKETTSPSKPQGERYTQLQAQLVAYGKTLADIAVPLQQQSQNLSLDQLKNISTQLTAVENLYNDFNTNQVKPSKRQNLIADEHLAPIDKLCTDFESLAAQLHQNLNFLIERAQTQESLYAAIASGSGEGIRKAVKGGADINQEKDGKTPIYFALALKKQNAVDTLADLGAKINEKVINYAIRLRYDWKPIVLLAIKGGVNLDAPYGDASSPDTPGYPKYTLLMRSVFNNDQDLALLLLKSGAGFSDKIASNRGDNFMTAVLHNYFLAYKSDLINKILEFIQELVKRGYNIRDNNPQTNIWILIKNKFMRTPLAKGKNSLELLIDLLLKNGADPNQKIDISKETGVTGSILTPLFMIINLNLSKEDARSMIEILLKAGADKNQKANIPGGFLVTPLAYASSLNKNDIVELLTARGASY